MDNSVDMFIKILCYNVRMSHFNKDYFIHKILPILITSALSALIAFLQNVLTGMTTAELPHNDPATAGAIGAILKGIHNQFKA